MERTSYVRQIAERLAPSNGPAGFAGFFVAVLRELAKGHPVSRELLAASLGWSPQRLAGLLEYASSTEYDDDQNIVGYGITLRQTAHAFEVDGRRLYTWCALDTLMFPALLGKTAAVFSRCASTGAPIILNVAPHELRCVQPAGVVMSLLLPEVSRDIRRSFCCNVHFFVSARESRNWLSKHPEIRIVGVREAFQLARGVAAQFLEGLQQARHAK
jgi:alkylmercury lyase